MSLVETPTFFAADVDAARVEWALKCKVSIPASCKISLIHLAIVEEPIGLKGLLYDKKSGLASWLGVLPSAVLSSYT